jgi:hypothetical protein
MNPAQAEIVAAAGLVDTELCYSGCNWWTDGGSAKLGARALIVWYFVAEDDVEKPSFGDYDDCGLTLRMEANNKTTLHLYGCADAGADVDVGRCATN